MLLQISSSSGNEQNREVLFWESDAAKRDKLGAFGERVMTRLLDIGDNLHNCLMDANNLDPL